MPFAAIPSPSSPVAFHLGPLPIRWYGLLLALGVVAGASVARRELRRRGFDPDIAYRVAAVCVPAGLVGARLYHVATDYELFQGHWGRAPEIWNGGLGLPGAVIGGGVGVYVAARRLQLPTLLLLDAIVPGLLLAQAIGRWGNYANQELFGGPTSLPWGLEIDPSRRPVGYEHVATFQPTFLYESLWDAAMCLALVWMSRRLWRRVAAGTVFLAYLVVYGAGRLVVESMRVDFAHRIGGLRVNQWLFGTVVLAAAALLVWRSRSRDRAWTSSRRPRPPPG